jgi:outer membrane receptor protein involved in Fe transport
MDALFGSGLRTDGLIPNGLHLPSYTQVNASVSHDFPHGITARLDVTNLFDAAYEIRDGGGIGVGAPQWGPRRGVYAGLTKAF